MSKNKKPSETAAGRFKRYPEYKESGAEWLAEIPVHWQTRRLKNLISEPITDGPHETPEFLPDGVPFLSVDGIQEGELIFDGCRYISEAAHSQYRTKCAPRLDDILLGKAASTGKIARVKVDFEFGVWSPLALIRPNRSVVVPAFLEYALKSAATQAQIDVLCTSSTQKNISMLDIPVLVLGVAPLAEQGAVVAFLDRETARIDALVAKKERLIELLQEKRSALISNAVTKGLDPNAPMKDSGMERLGQIPAHWAIVRLGRLATVANGSTPSREEPEYWADGSIPWLTSGKINEGIIKHADEFVTHEALRKCHLPLVSRGSVLVAITGEGQTRGKTALLATDATISQHLAAAAPRTQRLCAEFLWRFLQAQYKWLRSESGGAGSTRAALTLEFLKAVPIAVPPVDEQLRISKVAESIANNLDSLVEKVGKAIQDINELRTALISAAVTGKIDVRADAS